MFDQVFCAKFQSWVGIFELSFKYNLCHNFFICRRSMRSINRNDDVRTIDITKCWTKNELNLDHLEQETSTLFADLQV